MSVSAETVYGKLVRDLVPTIVRAEGKRPSVRTLTHEQFLPALMDKLEEEVRELREANADRRLDELADVWEVLMTICREARVSAADLEAFAKDKRERRGGFAQRLWLEAVTNDRL